MKLFPSSPIAMRAGKVFSLVAIITLGLFGILASGGGGGDGGEGDNGSGGGGGGGDTTPPTVISKQPVDDATGVGHNATISVVFNEAMDASTIDTGSVTLSSSGGAVSGTVSFDNSTFTLHFVPDAPLERQVTYTASLAGSITDLAGNPLAPLSWSFTTGSLGWGGATIIDSGRVNSQTPRIAMDGNGNAIAVWEEEGDIWANRYVAGSGWGSAVVVADNASAAAAPPFAYGPQIAVAPNGDAMVVWEQLELDGGTGRWFSHILASRYTVAGGWEAPVYVETSATLNAYEPHVAMDASGNALVVWVQDDVVQQDNDVWANRHEPGGGGWLGAELVDGDTPSTANPRVVFDASGNALVVWWDSTNLGGSAIWANRHEQGSGWQGTVTLASNMNEVLSDPRPVFDANGNAIVVWQQFDDVAWAFSIWANRQQAGSNWSGAVLLEQDDTGSNFGPDIAVDANGNAIVVWSNNDRNIIQTQAVRYDAASDAWSTPELIGGGIGNSDSAHVAMDAAGNAIAVWREGDNVGWYSGWANRYVAGSGWGTAELVENASGDVFMGPVVVDSNNGSAIAVWSQPATSSRDGIWANRFE